MNIEWVKKVYTNDLHNGFTALAYFDKAYYLAFRSAKAHLTSKSRQIIMKSLDGENWKVVEKNDFQTNPEIAIDYRDSFFVESNNELKLYSFCTPTVSGERQKSYSQVQVLPTGAKKWSAATIIKDNVTLWKPRRYGDKYFVLGYHVDKDHKCDLFHSNDGVDWKLLTHLGNGSEGDLIEKGNGNLLAFVRTERPPYSMEILESKPPFMKWTLLHKTPQIIQCPHLFQIDNRIYLMGRYRPDYMENAQKDKPSFAQHRTKIWEYVDKHLVEVLELPGAGDCSYPGTVFTPDGSLLVSYYSQRETPEGYIWGEKMLADIYIAKINLSRI